jgi:hypothetical protein
VRGDCGSVSLPMSCVADFPCSMRTAPTWKAPSRNAGTGRLVISLRFIPQFTRVFHDSEPRWIGMSDADTSAPHTRISAPFDTSDA